MKKKLKRIPIFKSDKEEFEFWDTHDPSEYKWGPEVKFTIHPRLKIKRKSHNGWGKLPPTYDEAIELLIKLQNNHWEYDSKEWLAGWEDMLHIIGHRHELEARVKKLEGLNESMDGLG